MRSTGIRFASVVVWLVASILGAPAVARAADKDLIELQRQVAVLTDQVNNLQTAFAALQSSMSGKLGAQGTLLQQTLDGVNQMQAANSASAKAVADALSQQEQKVAVPLAALNARIDQMIQTVSATQENVADITSRMGRLEQRMVDMENLMKVLQSPQPQAPPTPGGPPAGVTAQGLSQDAQRDMVSGKLDLALQEYTDYLKYFGDTESAAGAQFQIGEIQFKQGNLDQAIQAFDLVAGQYPMSARAPDALYEKAQVLKKQDHRSQASLILRQLVRQYPDSDAAGRAKADLATPAHK